MKSNKLQIPKEWWTKMVSGEMKYLFVLDKYDLKEGTINFVSFRWSDYKTIPKGTAHLKLVALNPKIYVEYVTDPDNAGYIFSVGDMIPTPYKIDKETYDFIQKRFINKKKDFKVYEISDVKEGK